MIIERNITIDGQEINCVIDFSHYRETGEDAEIVINSIKYGKINIIDLINSAGTEKLKMRCEIAYDSACAQAMMDRDESNKEL